MQYMHGNIWLLDPSCSSSPSTEVLQALGNDDFVGQGKFPHGNIFFVLPNPAGKIFIFAGGPPLLELDKGLIL